MDDLGHTKLIRTCYALKVAQASLPFAMDMNPLETCGSEARGCLQVPIMLHIHPMIIFFQSLMRCNGPQRRAAACNIYLLNTNLNIEEVQNSRFYEKRKTLQHREQRVFIASCIFPELATTRNFVIHIKVNQETMACMLCIWSPEPVFAHVQRSNKSTLLCRHRLSTSFLRKQLQKQVFLTASFANSVFKSKSSHAHIQKKVTTF